MTALRTINPSTIASSASNYSQAVLIEPGARVLHLSGQLGINPHGILIEGFEAQMRQAMANVFAILADVRMEPKDLVKLTVFSTSNDDATVQIYRQVRDELLADHAPAALFAAVAGFTHSDFLVEIEAVAAAK